MIATLRNQMERRCLMDNALRRKYSLELNMCRFASQSFLEKRIYFVYIDSKEDSWVR
uniref:Uncharacterized protein n=1 Tax=Lepeophtheirus salmonis TaxID=72036 RepID=A0A0K2UUA2_LEPSM